MKKSGIKEANLFNNLILFHKLLRLWQITDKRWIWRFGYII